MANHHNQTKVAIALLIAISMAIMGMIALVGAPTSVQKQGAVLPMTTSVNIQPNPLMNTNITWSNFYPGWNALEYNNSTANRTLPTSMSAFYSNPICINPTEIMANGTLQNEKIGGEYWNNTQTDDILYPSNGETHSISATKNGQNTAISMSTNGSKSQSSSITLQSNVMSISYLPSNNPAYDWFTISYKTDIPNNAGYYTTIALGNNTIQSNPILQMNGTGTGYITFSLAQIEKNTPIGFNLTGKNKLNLFAIAVNMFLPQQTTNTSSYTTTITGMAISTNPFTLGTSIHNGTSKTIYKSTGNLKLNAFAPAFPWQSITNNGYTVATSQQMQNLSTTQASLSTGEEVTYSGNFELPTAPDLSYSGTNITMALNVSGSQYKIANLNGVSYISAINGKTNGTYVFGSVNPNSANSMILQIDYSQSQWDSISSVPSIWTIAGIQYYWFLILGIVASVIGLGAGKFAQTKSGLRVR